MTDHVETDQALIRLRTAVARVAELTRDRVATGLSHQDADETTGTIGTDDAVGFDPFPLLRALHDSGVRVTVIGQVAGIMHGSKELTGDLDLLWDGDPARAPALAATFASVRAELTDDDGTLLACNADAFRLPKITFATADASGDCCTPALPWRELPITHFLARSLQAVSDDGLEVRYLHGDDLIRMRRVAGRPKDHRRADELERLNRPKPSTPPSTP
jgi:hypothetical protein